MYSTEHTRSCRVKACPGDHMRDVPPRRFRALAAPRACICRSASSASRRGTYRPDWSAQSMISKAPRSTNLAEQCQWRHNLQEMPLLRKSERLCQAGTEARRLCQALPARCVHSGGHSRAHAASNGRASGLRCYSMLYPPTMQTHNC